MSTVSPAYATQLGFSYSPAFVADQPSATLAATMDRSHMTLALPAFTSGLPVFRIIGLAAGVEYTGLAPFVAAAAVAGSHDWVALCDLAANVLAVSADGAGTFWTAASTDTPVNFTSPYIAPSTGAYYAVVLTAAVTTAARFGGATALLAGAASSRTPVVCGTLGAGGLTGPPIVGANLGAINPGGANNLYVRAF